MYGQPKKMLNIAVFNIRKGETARQCTAGIFYACTLNIYSATPVWKLNGPTALAVLNNRSVALFFFAATQTNFSEMFNTESTCLKAKHSSQQTTDAHEKGLTDLIELISELLLWQPDAEMRETFNEMFFDALSSGNADEVRSQKQLQNMVWCYKDANTIFDLCKELEGFRDLIRAIKYPDGFSNERIGTVPNNLSVVN